MEARNQKPEASCVLEGVEGDSRSGAPVIRLSGSWLLSRPRPQVDEVFAGHDFGDAKRIRFDVDAVDAWDTGLLIFLRACQDVAEAQGLRCELGDLPDGIRDLLELSRAVPEEASAPEQTDGGWLASLGERAWQAMGGIGRFTAFFGELLLDALAFMRGRAQLRKSDFFSILQSTGPIALPIVSLLSFLTGLIIAFIGVIQLQKFAADIYVADLVGLATTRELGAVMAGVIMAGRTGAAFAAQIGSMRVNDEVDALSTFGISPMQFLVLPRVLALVLMMPLLCVCADLVSILGGMVVAVTISNVSVSQYLFQVDVAVGLTDVMVGIFKSGVFGVIIALAGCYRGLNCGKDATAVGLAATSAVVTAITWIVVADAVFAVMFHLLGI
jgi:phospholipid/cholesterol/gamma-HCH transport system permease protein